LSCQAAPNFHVGSGFIRFALSSSKSAVQYLIGAHNEAVSVAMSIDNPDCSASQIDC
jgi:hypothetical protein